MTRDGSRRRAALLLGFLLGSLAILAPAAGPALAQSADCTALRAEIDASGSLSAGAGSFDGALRQQRSEIARTRAYADQSGCGDGFFDDPDSPECRALARRVQTLQVGLQRLEDQAARGDPAADDRRRALLEQFNAECTAAHTEGDPADGSMPLDPDAPAPAPAPPAQEAPSRSATVLCVRHCDGAYYPLAVDVPASRLGDMDRICQTQCPAATASAYAGQGLEDVANAVATDGTRYADLATAFQFRKGPSKTCACRAANQSWSEALAGAEAMLEPHKGDVTVTPAVAAAMMARSAAPAAPAASAATPARPSPPAKKATRRPATPSIAVPAPDPSADPGPDLTQEFRRGGPTF